MKEKELIAKRRCFKFRSVVKELVELGFVVKKITYSQFRINDMIDVYPAERKYHNLMTKERGDIRDTNIRTFVKKALGIANYQ